MNTPIISVVVCTYNRASLLRRSLESLGEQTLPPHLSEFLLVNDGSTDETEAVAAECQRHLPNLQVINQPNTGLGAARNAGWRAAHAPIIAFLDDDAMAPRNWLEKICDAFSNIDSQIAVIGGPIDPDWQCPPPEWLTRDLQVWLTAFDLGSEAFTTADRPIFGGANMAIRRKALLSAGGFRQDLGRRKSSLLSHEESQLWIKLKASGWLNRYLPDLRVRHFVPSDRMNMRWFRSRLYWEGISVARHEEQNGQFPLWHKALRWIGRWVWFLRRRTIWGPLIQPWRWRQEIRWQTECAYQIGYMTELLWRALRCSGAKHAPQQNDTV